MNHIDHKKRDTQRIEQMFSGIAHRYDLLNHVLSFGFDFIWRRRVAEETGKISCKNILDVCTGTGDMAIELCRFWKGKAQIEGLDFSRELIDIGRKKVRKSHLQDLITLREGDAENLPYDDGRFDAVTITFGLRNINDRLKSLKEFYRVTRLGGRFLCLEFSSPTNPLFSKMYFFYLMKIVPFISRLFGSDPAAYQYLGETISDFLSPETLVSLIEAAGWKEVTFSLLTGGTVAIHRGIKQ